MADGYCYFNDDRFWRCHADGSALQIWYPSKGIWVLTNDIADIVIKDFRQNNISGGSTALPPGGEGVEDAVNWAIAIANDESHGYDQNTRDSGVDFDCSSLTCWAFRENGFDIPFPSCATFTMVDVFEAAGFTWYPGMGNDSSELYRGDILLNINNHVAIYIGDGQLVEASQNEFGDINGGAPGDQSGAEIHVGGFYSYPWDGILRYV